jgi:transposase InsO family protein
MMETIYYDPSNPGSFGGVAPLVRQTRSNDAKNWLSSQNAYTLHKPVRRIFPRRKTYAKGIGDLFQADLADMQNISRYNDGHRYILTCVDVFSKRAFAVPLKNKTGSSVAEAFEKIFREEAPLLLQTDRGSEFLNANVQSVFKKYNIKHYWSLNDDIKAACVERFNRTLKTRMYRYFTHRSTNRWLDVLPQLMKAYNSSFHRTIGMAPDDVTTANEAQIVKRMYPSGNEPQFKYNVGDKVRISKYKNLFEQGYLANWTDEIFVIAIRHPTKPATYGLTDLLGEDIKGKFYEQELQMITKSDDVYIVEKILKTRRRNGKLEHLVKWQGYADKFNSWSSDVHRIQS